MATRDTTDGEPAASSQAVPVDGFDGVVRARRLEPAGPARKRREQQLVAAHQHEANPDAESHVELPCAAQLAEHGDEISFSRGERCIHQLAAGNGDHVE